MFNNITLEKIVRTGVFLLALGVVLLILFNYINLVAYAIIALLLTYLLDPIVNRLQVAGMNRTLSISVTLATVILVIIWISTSVIPIIAGQMAGLTRQLNIDTLIFVADQIETQIKPSAGRRHEPDPLHIGNSCYRNSCNHLDLYQCYPDHCRADGRAHAPTQYRYPDICG